MKMSKNAIKERKTRRLRSAVRSYNFVTFTTKNQILFGRSLGPSVMTMERIEIRNEARSAVTLSLLLDHDSQKENSSNDPSNGKKSLFAITSVTQGNALTSGSNENANDMQHDNRTCTNLSSRCSSPDVDDEDIENRFNMGRWIVFESQIKKQTSNPPVALDIDSDQYKIEPSWLINCVHPDPNSNGPATTNNSSNIHSKPLYRSSHSADHQFPDSHRPVEPFSPESNNFQWQRDQRSVPNCSGLDDCGEDDHEREAGTSARSYRHHQFRCYDSSCKMPPSHSMSRPQCQMSNFNCIHHDYEEFPRQRGCAHNQFGFESTYFRNAPNFGCRPHPNDCSYCNAYHCDSFCFEAQNRHFNSHDSCRCNYREQVIDSLITRIDDILMVTTNLANKLTQISDEDISVPRSYISFLLRENKILEREICMYKHQLATNNYQPQRFQHPPNFHSAPPDFSCTDQKLNFVKKQNHTTTHCFHPCNARREYQKFKESHRNPCYYYHHPSFRPTPSNKPPMARNQHTFDDKESPVIDVSFHKNYPQESSGLAASSSQNHNFQHEPSTTQVPPQDTCRDVNSNSLKKSASSQHQNLEILKNKTDLFDDNYVGPNSESHSQSIINVNKDCDETRWNLSERNASLSLNQIDSGLSMISNHIPEISAVADDNISQNSSLMSSAKSSEPSGRPHLGTERRGRFELRRCL